VCEYNIDYLKAKKEKLGHLLELEEENGAEGISATPGSKGEN
jgi:hypothetical protein